MAFGFTTPVHLYFFLALDIHICKMQRVYFYLKFKRKSWQNTPRFLCKSMHISICSGPHLFILKKGEKKEKELFQ